MNQHFLEADELHFIDEITRDQRIDLAIQTAKKSCSQSARFLEWLVRKVDMNTLKISRIAIARALGVSQRTISRWARDLEAQGLLKVKRTYLGDGMNDLNEYRLSAQFWRKLTDLYLTTSLEIAKRSMELAKKATGRLKALFGGGDKLAPNTLNIVLPPKNSTDSTTNFVDFLNDRGKHIEIPF